MRLSAFDLNPRQVIVGLIIILAIWLLRGCFSDSAKQNYLASGRYEEVSAWDGSGRYGKEARMLIALETSAETTARRARIQEEFNRSFK